MKKKKTKDIIKVHIEKKIIADWANSFFNKWESIRYGFYFIPPQKGKKKKKRTSSRKNLSVNVIHMAYDYIGFPDKEQEIFFKKTFGCRRFIWNQMKADRDEAYEKGITLYPKPSEYKNKYPWLKEVDSMSLSNTQLDLEGAYSDYLSGNKGKPKFKKKHLSKDSYTTNLSNKKSPNLYLEENLLKLPKCKNPVRLKLHRKPMPGGVLKRCTVHLLPTGVWHFVLLFEYKSEDFQLQDSISKFLDTGDSSELSHIGLDMSLPNLFVSSDGTLPEYINKGHLIS